MVASFPTDGVRLSAFPQIIEECGGRNALANLTTTQVCERFVKPATARLEASYCEMLARDQPGAVGKATVFISHAWKCVFLDVVDALLFHFREEGEVVVWFDLFSNNQHRDMDLDFDWCCSTFKSAIQKFGRTVMVLAPWHDPVPLTRGWCLFELYCTADTGSVFEVAMSLDQQQSFLEAMARHGMKAMNQMLATINEERSECWKSEDRDRIFDAVRRTVGFAGINAMVIEQLRGWVVAMTVAALRGEGDRMMALKLKDTLAKLHEGEGKYDLAEPYFVEVLATRKQMLGHRHQSTLAAMNNLAGLYNNQGKYNMAEALFVECLAAKKDVLGNRHPDTLTSLTWLATVLDTRGQHDKAESLYVECLATQKEVLGDRHPDTLISLNNLASLYNKQGKYDQAEPLLAEVVAAKKAVLGNRHPSTLISLNNLAFLYDNQGQHDHAEPLYVECVGISKEVHGEDHPDTVTFKNNLRIFYKAKKQREEEKNCTCM